MRTPAGQSTSTTVSPTARGVCTECAIQKNDISFVVLAGFVGNPAL